MPGTAARSAKSSGQVSLLGKAMVPRMTNWKTVVMRAVKRGGGRRLHVGCAVTGRVSVGRTLDRKRLRYVGLGKQAWAVRVVPVAAASLGPGRALGNVVVVVVKGVKKRSRAGRRVLFDERFTDGLTDGETGNSPGKRPRSRMDSHQQ